MTLPGVEVSVRERPGARTPPTDTSTAFLVGFATKGNPAAAGEVRSIGEFEAAFGIRRSDSPLWDAVDVYFREGGTRAYIGRVIGPTPVTSSATFLGAANADSITVEASSPGDWGDGLEVAIAASGGSFTITVTDASDDSVLEVSPSLDDVAAAVVWGATATYVRVIADGTADPVTAAATALTGGDDDTSNATETEWAAAIDLFGADLGPGQVLAPGRTTQTSHEALLAHAGARNRVALIDLTDTATAATLVTAAGLLRSHAHAKRGAAFAPLVEVPFADGSSRTVPASAVMAGLYARNDVLEGAGVASAGSRGVTLAGTDVSQDSWSDSDREALNDAHVNVVRAMLDGVRNYGHRSLAASTDPAWRDFTAARVVMAIQAHGEAVGERYVFGTIDGEDRLLGRYRGELGLVCETFYRAGALKGATAAEAYAVLTADPVNTAATAAAGQIKAQILAKVSETAERVLIEIVKVPSGEAL